jgi:putative transcriptional regulator
MKQNNTALSLRNHFLIAMPALEDNLTFHGSIAYICDHSEDGAMGIILNQPTSLSLQDIFDDLEITTDNEHPTEEETRQQIIYSGGPVDSNRGFILHLKETDDTKWKSSEAVSPSIQLTTSSDILSAMAQNRGPLKSLIALGYSGWGPGQLEQEILNNDWLTIPADDDIIFHTPHDQRVEMAARKLGVNLSLLAPAGHA